MKNKIFVTSKHPCTPNYIPSELKGCLPVIDEYEVIKRTEKGYRLRVSYAPVKGSMFLDENYAFFKTYESALKFVSSEANRFALKLEKTKRKAVKLMLLANDELRKAKGMS
ncbi:hypothetical protein [Klebsiella pneumoniae]|uniref:hypothetical protein n=1 Tax=Klebsiella pneumoniae TaxID=573 RepID=UPI0028772138|nr:hypothetical protein [Klebsiella pneumoniae]MDS0451925.1 hypothetical protein [Klebsiella pneumoniae]HDD0116497.1 hypothetical protein [Escherichia coli]